MSVESPRLVRRGRCRWHRRALPPGTRALPPVQRTSGASSLPSPLPPPPPPPPPPPRPAAAIKIIGTPRGASRLAGNSAVAVDLRGRRAGAIAFGPGPPTGPGPGRSPASSPTAGLHPPGTPASGRQQTPPPGQPVHYSSPEKCLRLRADRTLDKPNCPSSKELFSFERRGWANPRRKPEANAIRQPPAQPPGPPATPPAPRRPSAPASARGGTSGSSCLPRPDPRAAPRPQEDRRPGRRPPPTQSPGLPRAHASHQAHHDVRMHQRGWPA